MPDIKTYLFEKLDTNRDGILQESEAEDFKRILRAELKIHAGDNEIFDTAEKFAALEKNGYTDYRLYGPEICTTLPSTLPSDTVTGSQAGDEIAGSESDLRESSRISEWNNSANRLHAAANQILKNMSNKTGCFRNEIDPRPWYSRLLSNPIPYSLDQVVDNIYNSRISKAVGHSLSDMDYINANSSVRVTQREHDLYEEFKPYAKQNAYGSYILNVAGAQKLMQSYKRKDDKFANKPNLLDDISQQPLMNDTQIYCGKNPGETCAKFDTTLPLGITGKANDKLSRAEPKMTWTFYNFMKP